MARFDYAIKIILRHEGGLADNPHDPGGITNWGISKRFLDRTPGLVQKYFGHEGEATRDEIRAMPKDLAIKIYDEVIWTPNHYGDISNDLIATKVFDCTVNMGEKWGETFAQQSANRLGASLVVDGQIGPKSIAAINACDPMNFLKEYCQQMRERYEHIVLRKPQMAVFLKGWLARAAWPLSGE
jgi:lysozyme family protein